GRFEAALQEEIGEAVHQLLEINFAGFAGDVFRIARVFHSRPQLNWRRGMRPDGSRGSRGSRGSAGLRASAKKPRSSERWMRFWAQSPSRMNSAALVCRAASS